MLNKLCLARVLESLFNFDTKSLGNLGCFRFQSVSLWDDSWWCLFNPSIVSFKSWLSGTVSTCSLEECQLCLRSCDKRTMAFSYTATTQVAVVCLEKKKKNYFRNCQPLELLWRCLSSCLAVWLFVPMCTVTHVLSCPFAVWFTKVKLPQGKKHNHMTTFKVVELRFWIHLWRECPVECVLLKEIKHNHNKY